ncbi:class A beta-lactamase-related serine hydrolase [Streptomyces sp. WAC07061]|uniref:serine hydrolase domain-containing protein n=1 Tax=Streptomyces sp. WAC07061 TaxID=2487410 RepID=UPI000F7B5B4C|nr:serine hydrolase domain-containing protein [Streptomyces sp. WAC07061]RSS52903.1 class A beta-lactamase-related serine hydrolase [Streptomyces sp. WAC07061]
MNARSRTFHRIAVTGVALAALTIGAGVPAALAAPAPASAASAAHGGRAVAQDPVAMRELLARLPDGVSTSALVRLSGKGLRAPWTGSAGPVAAEAGAPIGSVTKLFTDTLVLRLAAEHRIAVDAPVRHYLPDLIPAGYAEVTVRQLMDHTGDLPMVSGGPAEPREVVLASFAADAAARPGRVPAPGTVQQYNGMNSFVAGLLVERISGRTYEEELRRQILRPLGLRQTGMSTDPRMAWYWAEGGLVSTAADLDRFITALLGGRLLPPAQQRHLYEVPDVPNSPTNTCLSPKACFSAGGLMRHEAGGTTVWGKTGSGLGRSSGVFATGDGGRRLVYAYTPAAGATRTQQVNRVVELVNAGFAG